MTDWKDPEPDRKELKLSREKLPCGCWSYFQDCGDYAVYSLLVKHRCQEDHEISVAFKDGPPGITSEVGVRHERDVIHTPETPQLGGVRDN